MAHVALVLAVLAVSLSNAHARELLVSQGPCDLDVKPATPGAVRVRWCDMLDTLRVQIATLAPSLGAFRW